MSKQHTQGIHNVALVQVIKDKCRLFLDIDHVDEISIETVQQSLIVLIEKYIVTENVQLIVAKNMTHQRFHIHAPQITIAKQMLSKLAQELNESLKKEVADLRVYKGICFHSDLIVCLYLKSC